MREKSYLLYVTLLSLVVSSVIYALSLFSGTEYFLRDTFTTPRPFSSDIVILSIDDSSIKELGQWPWPRATFAKLFLKLETVRPKVVGFDVMLSEDSRLGGNDDAALTQAISRLTYPLVMPVEAQSVESERGVFSSSLPLTKTKEEFASAKNVQLGHVNLILDRDGVVRRYPTSFRAEGANISSFSILVAAKAGASLPDNGEIIYSAYPGSIRTISVSRFLNEGANLKDKIVLIGATSPDLHDEKPTPLSRGTQMAGVEIQANIVNQILKGYRAEELPVRYAFLLLFVLSFIPFLFFAFSKRILVPVIGSAVLLVLLCLIILFGEELGFHFPIVAGLVSLILSSLGLLVLRYFLGDREKRTLTRVFSKYVSPEVLNQIIANPELVVLGGEEKEITVLFSDIRGFTSLSEKLSPTELVGVLNRYFTKMTAEVLKHGGVLDKYIGDAVMAFWGAPLPDSEQANHAYLAAEGMITALREFNEELVKESGLTIDIGIGLYTGKAVVGNVGSEQRFDYTAMGDTVNVASRLEGLNKEHKTHLIIGETTREKITLPAQFISLGSAKVKGREQELKIFTIEK